MRTAPRRAFPSGWRKRRREDQKARASSTAHANHGRVMTSCSIHTMLAA